MWTILVIFKSLSMKPGDFTEHRFTRRDGLVQCESMPQNICNQSVSVSPGSWYDICCWPYLSMLSTRQDLTQGLFFIVGILGGWEIAHKMRPVCCWSILVLGSLGAMWTMLVIVKYPGGGVVLREKMPAAGAIYLTHHRFRTWYKAVLWWGQRTNRDSCHTWASIRASKQVLWWGWFSEAKVS